MTKNAGRNLALLALLGWGSAARAGKLPTAEVLTLGPDARSLGMAEATLAYSRADLGALPSNPLTLFGLETGGMSFSRALLVEGISLDHAAYGRRVGVWAVGLSALRLDYGELPERDAAGTLLGGLHPADTVLQLSAAGAVGRFETGLSLKWVESKIAEKATAFAGDVAVRLAVREDLRVAAALRNLGTEMEFEAEKAPLPASGAVGLSWTALDGLALNVDANYPFYTDPWIALGGEFVQPAGKGLKVFLRAGANTRNPDLGGLAGFHAGAGAAWRALSVDYSYDPFGDLGNSHRLSVGYRW